MRALEGNAIGHVMIASRWLFAFMEVVHFVGLTLLVAGIAAFDLRILGVARNLQPAVLHRFLGLALVGFLLTAVSGVLFFLGDPVRYGTNPLFMAKMGLIVLAGLNALAFERLWFGRVVAQSGGDPPLPARALCLASLLLWSGIIVTGRLLPQFARTF